MDSIFHDLKGYILYRPEPLISKSCQASTAYYHFIAVKIHFIVFHIQAKFKKYSHVMHFFLFEMYLQKAIIHFMS